MLHWTEAYIHRAHTGHENLGKSWNLMISFPGLESPETGQSVGHGKSWKAINFLRMNRQKNIKS